MARFHRSAFGTAVFFIAGAIATGTAAEQGKGKPTPGSTPAAPTQPALKPTDEAAQAHAARGVVFGSWQLICGQSVSIDPAQRCRISQSVLSEHGDQRVLLVRIYGTPSTMMVSTPVRIQTSSNQPDDPTSSAMPAETMKMPDPTIEPATSIVVSKRPSFC